MSTDRFSRAFKASILVHAVVIVLLVVVPVALRWASKDKKKEELIFIELVQPAPPPPVTRPDPQPVEEEKPEPPKPEPKPEPKPKPTLKKADQIKVNTNRVVRQPSRPRPKPLALNEYDLKKQLSSSLPTSASDLTPVSDSKASELSRYYGTIYSILNAAWDEPPSISGLSVEVALRIGRNGGILNRELAKSSGNQAMDDSVMRAVRSVATFPKLPDTVGGAFIDVTIKFESTGLSM